jgi:quercetin dioxygenase-like cupin family protein
MSLIVRSAIGIVIVVATSLSCARPAATTTTSVPTTVTVVAEEAGELEMNASAGMQWSPFSMPGFAPGVQLAVIHGNPSAATDYTIRLKFPDGYEVPPHWHPKSEHVTVLQGFFSVGMGERVNASAMREFSPGDFLYAPPRMPHYAKARGETVVQLHGQGPFEVRVVAAAR